MGPQTTTMIVVPLLAAAIITVDIPFFRNAVRVYVTFLKRP